jgi:uncharacterized protein
VTKQETIQKILAEARTIAVVGFSSKPHRAGQYVPAYLQQHGYRVIPVNPHLKQAVLGETPYATLSDIGRPVDLVLIFQRSEKVPPFVEEAIAIGAKAVWMQSGITNAVAAERARAAGLDVVENACMKLAHQRWWPVG